MANYSAIPFPTFQRAMRNILTLSSANPAVIVTTYDGVNPGAHQYETGMIVRLVIPAGFGVPIIQQQEFTITVIDQFTFSIPLDTTATTPFAVPPQNPGHNYTAAQVIPISEQNDMLTSATQNVLPFFTGIN